MKISKNKVSAVLTPEPAHLNVMQYDNIYKNPNVANDFIKNYYNAKQEQDKINALLKVIKVIPHYFPYFDFESIKAVLVDWFKTHSINDMIENDGLFKGSIIHYALKSPLIIQFLIDSGADLDSINSKGKKVVDYYHLVSQNDVVLGSTLDTCLYEKYLEIDNNNYQWMMDILNVGDILFTDMDYFYKLFNRIIKSKKYDFSLFDTLIIYSHDKTAIAAKKNKLGYETIPLMKDLYYYNFAIKNVKNHKYLMEMFFKEQYVAESIKSVFGINSKKVKEIFNDTMTYRKQFVIDGNKIAKMKLMAEIFLRSNMLKPNINDCIAMMERVNGNELLNNKGFDEIMELESNFNFIFVSFMSNFIDEQKMVLIEESVDKNDYIFMDTMMIYKKYNMELDLILKQRKWNEKNSWLKIHDLFVQESKKFMVKNFILKQEDKFSNAKFIHGQKLSNGMHFAVAKDQRELFAWGDILDHCVGTAGYGERALNGDCLIIGVMRGFDPVYTIEIRDMRVIQIQGKSNTKPEQNIYREIESKLRQFGLIN